MDDDVEKPAESNREKKPQEASNNEHVVVINGKKRELHKRSQYMMDMLTFDDE